MLKAIELKNFYFSKYTDNCPNMKSYFNNLHIEYEMYLFIEGDAEFIIEKEIYSLKPFDFVIIKPGKYHYINLLSPAKFSGFLLNFNEKKLISPILKNKLADADTLIRLREPTNNIAKLFAKMLSYHGQYDVKTMNLLSDAFLIELFVAIEEEVKTTNKSNNVSTITEQIIEYIDENIEKKLSLDVLSSALFTSPSHLSHSFSKDMNISIMKYVNKKKAYRAYELILQGVSASQACSMCSYNDYTTFYKSFKKIFGMKPSDIKK